VSVRYLLDTTVLSETRRKQADLRVMAFLAGVEPSALYVSVLALGELRKGVAMKAKADPEMAERLGQWVDGLEFSFAERIVGIDGATAARWGELSAQRPRPVIDTLLAATAAVHGMTLVTRNLADFEGMGIETLNPWLPVG
jgi:predicted nucleic acid-binding protein